MLKIKLLAIVLFYFPASYGQIQKITYKQLAPYLQAQNDTMHVVNFWASWCVPCREELPAFEKLNEKYAGKKVKVLLVSLDFPSQVEKQLIPFIRKNNIKSEVILLDDPNQNEWIDKVDPKWSGALPFTQIYGKGFRQSFERSFRFNELDSLINLKLNIP